jgi:hypothetical protein
LQGPEGYTQAALFEPDADLALQMARHFATGTKGSVQQKPSVDHIVGYSERRRRYGAIEGLRSLET